MKSRKISVSSHLRKGKAVRAHNRFLAPSAKNTKPPPSSPLATPTKSQQKGRGKKTVLVDVNGRKADLSKVTSLENMDFDGMNLEDYDFKNVKKITSCYFFETKLSDLTFEDTKFISCDFEKSILQNVSFKNCILRNCLFKNAIILDEEHTEEKTSWSETEFANCTFEECRFENIKITKSGFRTCRFGGREDTSTFFRRCRLSYSQFHDTVFQTAHFADSIFEESFFALCSFRIKKSPEDIYNTNLTIEKSKMVMVSFFESNLEGANIVNSTIRDSVFQKSEGPNLNFEGSTISNTAFLESDLRETDFSSCVLNKCEIEESDLTRSEWENTKVSWGPIFSTGDPYEQYRFEEAITHLGITEKQFEFLVLSNALEVRDNETKRVVKKGFDPEKHHLPPWIFGNPALKH